MIAPVSSFILTPNSPDYVRRSISSLNDEMIFIFGTLKNDHMLTLSCIAQIICDLAFLLATAQKSLKQKNYEKNLIPG